MVMITGSVTAFGVTTNREDLSDTVYLIEPSDTPFMNSVPRKSASNVLHEWSTDALDAVNTSNARLEGDALTRGTSVTPTRLVNYCQISSRDATVSGTQLASNPAGIRNMMAHQMMKKSKTLKRDIESILLGNTGQNAGGTTTARRLRSFNAWFGSTTNALRGTGGANSTAATAAATDATAGSLRAFSEILLKEAILGAYNLGGEPTMALVSAKQKQVFSGFTGRAASREMIPAGRVNAQASVYASDFGDILVKPNRTQRDRDVYVVDPSNVAIAYLRPFEVQELGRVGDGITRDIIAEYTLQMGDIKAHAGIFDLS
jgi:hypothetical protein